VNSEFELSGREQRRRIVEWARERRARLCDGTPDQSDPVIDVLALLGRHHPISEWEAAVERVRVHLDTLGDDGCRRVWEALFPKLAVHLERAATDFGYRSVYHRARRLPFWGPRRPDVVGAGRAALLAAACSRLAGHEPDAVWLATWANYLPYSMWDIGVIGCILGAVLRGGGAEADAVRTILYAAIDGQHEHARMGPHVLAALLNSPDRADWETVGRLLLAAQRAEGLREAVLNVVADAPPAALRYVLGLVHEHRLARFSSVVAVFNRWLALQWAGGSERVVQNGVARIISYLDDPAARQAARAGAGIDDVYYARWAAACQDVDEALPDAAALLADADPERRYVALHFLVHAQLFPESLDLIALPLMERRESDLRLLMASLQFMANVTFLECSDELFDATVRLFEEAPARPSRLEPIVWPWAQFVHGRPQIAEALRSMAVGNPEKLIPYARHLSSDSCAAFIGELSGKSTWYDLSPRQTGEPRPLTPAGRRLMISLCGDARPQVSEAAFAALDGLPVEEDEVAQHVSRLHRTAAALRMNILRRLSLLPDDRALELLRRLVADRHAGRRRAGIELARRLIEDGRGADAVRQIVAERPTEHASPEECAAAGRALRETIGPDRDRFLGLVPPGSRTPLTPPRNSGVAIETPATAAYLRELGALLLAHGDTAVTTDRFLPGERRLLLDGGIPYVPGGRGQNLMAEARARLPLVDVWLKWLAERGPETRDPDGLEPIRAWVCAQRGDPCDGFPDHDLHAIRAFPLICTFESLTHWLAGLARVPGALALLVQHAEDGLAGAGRTPGEERVAARADVAVRWPYRLRRLFAAERFCRDFADQAPITERARLGVLQLIAREHHADWPTCPDLERVVDAYAAGMLHEVDIMWALLRGDGGRRFGRPYHYLLRHATSPRAADLFRDHRALPAIVERVRGRILDVELARGELPGVATDAAAALTCSGGAAVLFRVVTALGRDPLSRDCRLRTDTRSGSFSRLIAVSAPAPDDTPASFAARFAQSGVRPARMIEVALLAPHWGAHIEQALALPGLAEAAWWIHAHTRDAATWRDNEHRDPWAARIAERTELSAEDLLHGAVDVAWFQRVIARTGPDGWDRVQRAAKFASGGAGHTRAQLFAAAMLGQLSTAALEQRISATRHQDSVRAFGLVPLPRGKVAARAEALRRYQFLEEFRRQGRRRGSQRQASERLALDIALQNLARAAGYRDPRRLQWAMEAAAVADLARGPVRITDAETTITLAIDDDGAPALSAAKKGRPLASVPARLGKRPDVKSLRDRFTELRRQRTRMRASLEASMCRGEVFRGPELKELCSHPMLRPMVERLVFIGRGARSGYPGEGGRALCDYHGTLEGVGRADELRVAHPFDLFARGDWSDWQRDCFAAERVQPFKQLFRELYPKTAAERAAGSVARRYAGHQVNPRQALALLGGRQWVHAPEMGLSRTFHDEQLTAWLDFEEHFWTAADVEGLTLDGVTFVHADGRYECLPLADVPDRVFSETMRDLDLVVSVAHTGGVDPEASASTIEMRARLVLETCRLLGLTNVRVSEHFVLIDGTRASYSVHLGSAGARLRPGPFLVIVAVHSQYRGRLFLPFADDDPRTAEVLAKTLLLARDDEIQDPGIIAQLPR